MHESEWQTRKERIDTRLRQCNPAWHLLPWQPGLDVSTLGCHVVTEFPTSNGPADYAFIVEGQLLGILEAKKVSVNPQNVLEQAKRYAEGASGGPGNWNGFRVPFLYASNGEVIWHLDVRAAKPVSRIISHFHTAPALAALLARNPKPAHDWLLDTPPDHIARLRDYQRRCIIATEQALISGRCDLLLALATGTGKTFLTVAQVYRLLKSGLVRRVLFLVDRKVLAAQAVREFNAFNTPQGNKLPQEYELYSQRFQRDDFGDEDPFDPKVLPNEYLTAPKPGHTFVYVSIVKHAAAGQAPLLTAEERVNRALDKFITAHTLNPDQKQWLSLIREHLVKNLCIDEEDFDLAPLLEMRGGKAKAKRVFGDIAPFVTALNTALAT